MAPPRFHTSLPAPEPATSLRLPDAVSRHMQVLRLQPGDAVVLFDDADHEWLCRIVEMDRRSVAVRLEQRIATPRELPLNVQLALGMPANDRMDAMVEKATELGANSIQPLVCARSVLRLDGERAAKRVAHWNSVAISSAEQSGRTRLLRVQPVSTVHAWIDAQGRAPGGEVPRLCIVLSTGDAPHLSDLLIEHLPGGRAGQVILLSGPEGGLSMEEETVATAAGFLRASLGPRVLRADTAPLAALTLIAARCESSSSRTR